MKGFKDKKKKFHPIAETKGVRKSRDKSIKTTGIRLRRTNEQRLEINNAFDLGKKAFEDGKSSIPAEDPNVMKLLKGRKVGDKLTIPLLKAWSRGWHDTNIKKVNENFEREMAKKKKLNIPDPDPHQYGQIILDQLGESTIAGFPFFKITGIKDFVLLGEDTVMFKNLPKNPNKITNVTVVYDIGKDLYRVHFFEKNQSTIPTKSFDDVFVDQLPEIIGNELGIR